MKVRIGVSLGPAGTPAGFASAVDLLEQAGVDSLWLPENVYSPAVEPFTGMAFALSRTRKLKVGTGISVLPGRHPVLVAGRLPHPEAGSWLNEVRPRLVVFAGSAGWAARPAGRAPRRWRRSLACRRGRSTGSASSSAAGRRMAWPARTGPWPLLTPRSRAKEPAQATPSRWRSARSCPAARRTDCRALHRVLTAGRCTSGVLNQRGC